MISATVLWTVVAVAVSLAAQPIHGMAFTVFQAVVEYYRMLSPEPMDAVPDAAYLEREYDFVVVGAGSGGSVVANRLTEVAGWSVLLLEAGAEENTMTDVPILVSILTGTSFDWGYRTEQQDGLFGAMKGRKCRWPRGKVMGGTSVLNFMVYTRGSPDDYDNWARLGNDGWSYADVLPYFKKSENIRPGPLNDHDPLLRSPYHGHGGYLSVEEPLWKTPIAPAFLRAGRELGYNVSVDHSGLNPVGFSYVRSTTVRGKRCSASKAFLRPIRKRPNFTVTKRSMVTKILIDSRTKRAYGVRFVKNKKTSVVYARKEVILCAGALNSPQLLMLSGVGPAYHLSEIGVPVISDLRVGYNLQDHICMIGLVFLVNQSVSMTGRQFLNPKYFIQYTVNGKGLFALPGGAEALAFTVTRYAGSKYNWPDMELVFGPGSMISSKNGSPVSQLVGMDEIFYNQLYGKYLGHHSWSLVPILLRPHSRGRIKLRSANPFMPPLFYSGYLTDWRDRETLVEGIKQAIAVSQTQAFQKYGSRLLPTPFPGCEHHPFMSDAYWRCTTTLTAINLHHQSGTCKMGPDSDPDAVVDPKLRVRGVKSLRVVDASVMPVIPAGHTNSVTFMIGEKAADMIKEYWLGRRF